ncbi:MAG: HAD hydrolase-like protein, partial [Candidatus Lokiarchaeota archaeon]|nr:HAD hydrolase-like protein [Candidatus Lokiarchaeota archaeon]
MLKKSSFKDKKVLVFDLDGTIVKLNVNWKKLKQILSERYSKIYNTSCQFNSISGCLSYVVSKDDKKELGNFFDIIREFEVKNIDNNTPIDESIYFIKHKNEFGIDGGVKLAILSLNSRKTIIESLKKEEILDKFDFIVGREDVRRWKPEPEGLI